MEEYEILAILYEALASKLGIVVRVSHFTTAAQTLTNARNRCGDPALQSLQFRQSPHASDELWIVRGGEVRAQSQPGDE